MVNEDPTMLILPAFLFHGQPSPVQEQYIDHLCRFAYVQVKQEFGVGKELRQGTVSLQKLCHLIAFFLGFIYSQNTH